MRIITSVHIYNFHLIISTLKEGLIIVPFGDNRKGFYNSKTLYSRIIHSEKVITELQGINHLLFGNRENKLTAIDLKAYQQDKFIYEDILSTSVGDISQISLDPVDRFLYTLSDGKGLFKVNTNQLYKENLEHNFIPKIFDKIGNPVVANIQARDKNIVLAIRNYGISLLYNEEERYTERQEIRTADPQDARKISNKDYLAIADSEEGIIIFDIKHSQNFRKIKLPENDFPQQIELCFGVIIIKGVQGLYAYHIQSNKLEVLRYGKIGTFAVYYDYIFFTSKDKIFALTLNNSFEKHLFSISSDLIDIEVLNNFNGRT